MYIPFTWYIVKCKDLMQGKLFKNQKCTHVMYCSLLGGNVNTRWISKPDIEFIFHIKNQWNILVIGNYYVNYQNYQNLMLILNEHWCIYSCLQIPPRENWFQYVRRVYVTAINFPCIITLVYHITSQTVSILSNDPSTLELNFPFFSKNFTYRTSCSYKL